MSSICISVTEQLTGIKLTESGSVPVNIEDPVSVVVMSRGHFISKVVMTLSGRFAGLVVDRMSNGRELPDEEREAYFLEFVNIFIGRFISDINNRTGHPSRFVIPVLLKGTYTDTADTIYGNSAGVTMSGEYGEIRINIRYDVLPDYSQLQGLAKEE